MARYDAEGKKVSNTCSLRHFHRLYLCVAKRRESAPGQRVTEVETCITIENDCSCDMKTRLDDCMVVDCLVCIKTYPHIFQWITTTNHYLNSQSASLMHQTLLEKKHPNHMYIF